MRSEALRGLCRRAEAAVLAPGKGNVYELHSATARLICLNHKVCGSKHPECWDEQEGAVGDLVGRELAVDSEDG
jgi:hypothetical protein